MATLTIPKGWADGDILLEADLDAIKSAVETFMNTTQINDDNIQASGITGSSKLIDGSVNAAKLATDSVTTVKIEALAVTEAKIAALAVTSGKLASGAVSTAAKIADSIITHAKTTHGTTAVTSAYTVLFSDEVVLCSTASGAYSVTLPSAATSNFRVIIKKTTTDANAVSIATTSSQTVDGKASDVVKLTAPNDWVELISNGTNWNIVNRGLAVIRTYGAKTTDQTIPNDTRTLVTVGSFDNNLMSNSGNQVDVVYPGYYSIEAQVKFKVNGAGTRHVYIYKNGTEIVGQSCSGLADGGGTYLSCSVSNALLAAGDYIQMYVYQNSGGNLDLDATIPQMNNFNIIRVAPSGNA